MVGEPRTWRSRRLDRIARQVTEARFNRPRPNWLTVGWNALGALLVGLGSYMVVASEFGHSENPIRATWFAGGLMTVGVAIGACFVLLNVWHAHAQREITIDDEQLRIRRWFDAVFGKEGRSFSLRDASVRFFLRGGGAKMRIEGRAEALVISIWFWSLDDVQALARALQMRGVPVVWDLPFARE